MRSISGTAITVRRASAILALLVAIYAALPSIAHSAARFKGEDIIREGLAYSYMLKLDEALATFKKLDIEHPNSPAATFYPAAVTWGYVELEYRKRKVAELHDYKTDREEGDYRHKKLLLDDMERTIEKCEKILDIKPDDFEASFYLAGAHGFASRMEFYSGNYLSAMLHGRRSALVFERLLETHPDEGDAMVGPGVYRYFVGKLSPPIRLVVKLLGLSGTREEGISLLETAFEKSSLSSMESADFLALIYGRYESDPVKALQWADRLEKINRYSPLADYHRLMAYHATGEREREREAAERLGRKLEKLPPDMENGWQELIEFTLGAIAEEKGESSEAAKHYNVALGSATGKKTKNGTSKRLDNGKERC